MKNQVLLTIIVELFFSTTLTIILTKESNSAKIGISVKTGERKYELLQR